VGIEDDVAKGLDNYYLAPNPAQGVIFLESKNNDQRPVDVQVFDMKGKLLRDVKGFFPQSPIDIQTLSTGLYMVKVQAGDQTKSIKFIKE
jgi:hypothetical protein